jgi:hypothetical protein
MHLIKSCEDFSKEEVKKLFKDEKKFMLDKRKVESKFDK